MKKHMKRLLFASLLAVTSSSLSAPKVLSSIYPLQQIANTIVGEPTELISNSYLSPHDYALKPSDTQQIAEADILLWIGEAMMPQLKNSIAKRHPNQTTITAADLSSVHLITSQHTHDHDTHESHSHHDHSEEHGEAIAYDPHLWLSTENAKAIATALTIALVKQDQANAERYQKNLMEFRKELTALKSHILGNFESNPPKPYFVFHDAYHYFEDEFGIEHHGVIKAHAGQSLRTKQLHQLQRQLKKTPNACLFREPQFDAPIIDKLAQQSAVTIAILDPVGYGAKQSGYPAILQNIAIQISHCQPE